MRPSNGCCFHSPFWEEQRNGMLIPLVELMETGTNFGTNFVSLSSPIPKLVPFVDPNTLAERYEYDHSSWWNLISNELVSSKNSIISIHNPTWRFLAKWLAMVVHSRTDLRLCSLPDLQWMYTMVNKIHFSPVRSMLAHWQKMITGKSPIDITPLGHPCGEVCQSDGGRQSHLLA